MYTQSQVTTAIELAVSATTELLQSQPDSYTLSSDDLITMSHLTPPTDDQPVADHQSWSLNLMYLRETWRDRILEETGRFPRTVYGYGFEILRPAENIDYASTTATRDIVKAIRKSSRILEKTRDSDLDMQERRRKINHQVRLGALEGSAQQAMRDAARERITLETKPNIIIPDQTFSE